MQTNHTHPALRLCDVATDSIPIKESQWNVNEVQPAPLAHIVRRPHHT